MVLGALESIFYVSIFLVSGKGEREAQHRDPLLLCTIIFFFQEGCTAMFYSAQGSVQPQETGENCTRSTGESCIRT